MSEINVTSALKLDSSEFLATLQATEREVRAFAARISSIPVNVPITLENQMTRAVDSLKAELGRTSIIIPAQIKDEITAAIEAIRTEQQSRPIFIPVIAQPVVGGGAGGGGGYGGAGGGGGGGMPFIIGGGGAAGAGAAAEGEAAAAAGGAGAGMMGRFGGGAFFGAYLLMRGAREIGDQAKNAAQSYSLSDSDPMKQLAEQREILNRQTTGARYLTSYLWNKIGVGEGFGSGTAEMDAAESRSKEEDAREKRNKQMIAGEKSLKATNEDLDQALANASPDKYAGRRMSIDETQKKSDEAADAVENAWRQYGKSFQKVKASADAMRAKAGQIAAAQTEQLNIDQRVDENRVEDRAANFNADISERTGEANLRAQGRDREAQLAGRKYAVQNRITKAYQAFREERDPRQIQARYQEYQQAIAAGKAEMGEVDANETRQRGLESTQSADAIADSQTRQHIASLNATGQTDQASIEQQQAAVNQRVRDAKEAADREGDPTRKAQLQAQATQAAKEGQADIAAIQAAAARRNQDAVAGFDIGAEEAGASTTPGDFGAQQKLFRDRWQRRLKNIQDPQARAAATKQMQAEEAAMNQRRADQLGDVNEDTRESEAGAYGGDKLAQVERLNYNAEKQIRDAGGDVQMRQAIARRTAAQLHGMTMGRPQTYSSWQDYLGSAQSSALDGGVAFKQIRSLEQTYGKAATERTIAGQDRDLSIGDKSIDKLADSIAKAIKDSGSPVYVVSD